MFFPDHRQARTQTGLWERRKERDAQLVQMRHALEQGLLGRFKARLDNGGNWVWNVGSEAQRAVEQGDLDRVHQILLASSGLPGAFPFREIDDSVYVDGGITGNILYGGTRREEETALALWTKLHPELPVPTVRFWVIFNNQLRPQPQVTATKWPAVVMRSLDMSARAATLTAVRHLFAKAEIASLKHGGSFEVRVVTVPDAFVPPKPGVFIKKTMNALADLGEKMGADPSTWRTIPA